MILCDTDIFIEALKNNRRAIKMLRQIGFENIALSAITVMELYFGAVNKREMTKIKNRLQQLRIVHVDQGICEEAMDLIERYAKSHGLHIPDALIAATAICKGIQLLTYNVKDFKFIKRINLYHPDV
jgi:predicted nucleic acid-binding protein